MDNHFGENCVVHQVICGMETRYLGIGTLMTQAVPYLGTDLDIHTYILELDLFFVRTPENRENKEQISGLNINHQKSDV